MPYDDAGAVSGEVERDDARGRGGAVAEAPPRPRERPAETPERDGDSAPRREESRRGAADGKNGDQELKDGDDGSKGGQDTKKKKSPWLWVFLAIAILAAVIGGGAYWYATKDQQTTDDAYTDGRAITVAAKVSGYVTELAVNDNQFVHAGDVLVRIDPRDYATARDQARGNLEVAQAQLNSAKAGVLVARKNFPARLTSARAQLQSARAALVKAQSDARRQHAVSRAATTQEQVDQADAALLQAQANVAQAEASVQQADPVQENIDQSTAQASQQEGQVATAQAQLAQAELNLDYATIKAPQDGWVTKRNVEKGNYLSAGGSIMSLVSPQVWVTANYKESQLDRMRPGQHVDIAVDAYPGLKLKGHVDSVQLGSGSKFTAFPPENATGNYVKIVQRVPVKIVIDEGLDPKLPLPLGLSVAPTVLLK